MVGCAAVNLTDMPGTHFFKGDIYIGLQWAPDRARQYVADGPSEFREWGPFKEANFSQIDAILPIPGSGKRGYWFSGSQFVRMTTDLDNIIGTVQTISEGWPSLAKAGFDHVDAACIVPGTSNLAYIFSGEQYCRVSFTEGQNNSELIYGPKLITAGWREATFKSVDMVLPRPGTTNGLYMFSGDKYVEVEIVPWGTTKLVKGPNDVATDWPGLRDAGFY